MRVPADRPVATSDVLSALNLPRDPRCRAKRDNACDAAWLLGLTREAWRAIVHDACSTRPSLLRPSQAILLRWLATQSAPLLVCHDGPGPRHLGAALARTGATVSLSELAVALGCSATAAARWAHDDADADTALRRICGALLGGGTNAHLIYHWRVWLACARQEAALRGLGTDLAAVPDWNVSWAPIVPRGRGRPPRVRHAPPERASLLVIEVEIPTASRRRGRR